MNQLLCLGNGFAAVHRSLARSFVVPSSPQALTEVTAQARLQDLVEATAICQASVCHSNSAQRSSAYNQWTRYLNEMGADPATANPSHAIAYLASYVKRGTFLTDGGPRCAPGSVKNQIGHLRKGASLYDGRVGPYDYVSQTGACG